MGLRGRVQQGETFTGDTRACRTEWSQEARPWAKELDPFRLPSLL